MTEKNVFDGFMTWVNVTNWLIQNKITRYEVKQNISEVEIRGDTIIIPPNLERIISKLLMEIPK